MKVFLVVATLAVIALLISSVFLFAPDWLPESLQHLKNDVNSRIGVAQIPIAVASLAALFLAAWEFRQAQKAPRLRIWIGIKDKTNEKSNLIKPSVSEIILHDYEEILVLLENRGDAVARWIKVSLQVINPSDFNNTVRLHPNSYHFEKWIPNDCPSNLILYNGGSDFVSYTRPKKVERIVDFLEPLGSIIFMHDFPEGINEHRIQVRFSIEANGSSREVQIFTFVENFSQKGKM